MTTRFDNNWESMRSLSERIQAANSVTEELERWCRERAIGDGRIAALAARDAVPSSLDDGSCEALYPFNAQGKTEFRRVQLSTAGIVAADALNWFFPQHLTPEICRQLETTTIPFERTIKGLKPKRRTFLVRLCTPGELEQAKRSNDLSWTAFEHRALVISEEGVPLAVVHERYRLVLALGAAKYAHA
jgi:hypothetical protein